MNLSDEYIEVSKHGFGNLTSVEASNIATYIFGHRFIANQRLLDLVLEFLIVLSGFGYNFNQGVTQPENELIFLSKYHRIPRFGLRRFVFYPEERASPFYLDQYVLNQVHNELKKSINHGQAGSSEIDIIWQLLSSYELQMIKSSRSKRRWFARYLLPVHHNFLYSDYQRRGTKKNKDPSIEIAKRRSLNIEDTEGLTADKEMIFSRLFHGRGGELYYLLISNGFKFNSDIKSKLQSIIYHQLVDTNQNLGQIAELIDKKWNSTKLNFENETINELRMKLHYQPLPPQIFEQKIREIINNDGTKLQELFDTNIGYLPEEKINFANVICNDVKRLFETEIELISLFELISYIIGLHVLVYMYKMSSPDRTFGILGEKFNDSTIIPIVCIEENNQSQAIKNVSISNYVQNSNRINLAASEYLNEAVRYFTKEGSKLLNLKKGKITHALFDIVHVAFTGYKLPLDYFNIDLSNFNMNEELDEALRIEKRKEFYELFWTKEVEFNEITPMLNITKIDNPKSGKKPSFSRNEVFRRGVVILGDLIEKNKLKSSEFIERYSYLIWNLYEDTHVKQTDKFHRNIGKDMDFIYPRTGGNEHYRLNSRLLKALIVVTVNPKTEFEPNEISLNLFLSKLYEKYGIIIGPKEAETAGLFKNEEVSRSVFHENREFLINKLRNLHLLREPSDSTYFVMNRLHKKETG